MKIRLHIERLVLDGLPVTGAQGPQIKAALETELRRLLSVHGVSRELASGGAVPSVRAPGLAIARGASAARVGTQIARSLHGGIGGKP
jgi:hypothetical protein